MVVGPDRTPYGATGQPFNEIVVDETVDGDRGCFACMLGREDGRTLYIVANHYDGSGATGGVVLTQRVDVPHAGRP